MKKAGSVALVALKIAFLYVLGLAIAWKLFVGSVPYNDFKHFHGPLDYYNIAYWAINGLVLFPICFVLICLRMLKSGRHLEP